MVYGIFKCLLSEEILEAFKISFKSPIQTRRSKKKYVNIVETCIIFMEQCI